MTKAAVLEKETAREIVSGLFEAYNEHDVEKILSFLAEDVEWFDPMLTAPVTGRDAAGFQIRSQFTAFPDLAMHDLEIYVADSGGAVASWRLTGTMTGPAEPPGFAPTGKAVEAIGVCVYEFDKGLISKHTIVYDLLGFLQQIGLMPADNSPLMKATAAVQRLTTPAIRRLLRK